MMAIALNGKILESLEPAGPEYFTYNLYRTLFKDFKDQDFLLYYRDLKKDSLLDKLHTDFPYVKFTQIQSSLSWTHNGLSRQLFKDSPEFYFSPEHTVPVIYPKNTKVVIMVHGLEIKSNKQFSKISFRFLLQWNLLKYACNTARLIVVPSEYTKEQILNAGLVSSSNNIRVIHEGVSDDFRKNYDIQQKQKIKDTYGIKNNYLLFVSTLQPRKNVVGLIRAFSLARKNSKKVEEINLVLVGKKGWNYEDIFESIKKENLSESVIYLGWIPQENLPLLFASAKGFVNFSFEEGFSLTLLEAMTSKIPCAVSSIPPHKQLGKDSVFYANPTDTKGMSEAIIKLVEESTESMTEKGAVYAQGYTWFDSAKKLIDYIHKIN
ncbi:glycosyltransferase family 4 protein [candidate division WWE3 bacterium]|uniref:Glycosyltransferase family 4 protein n=1 Tax=candidate division WWE3 bacterium TaxID=2053526 RepID=A0A7X9DJM2_UNCKA|nr:glycosyltransferase family 4 protein [candidate division WWE3 bacterium]